MLPEPILFMKVSAQVQPAHKRTVAITAAVEVRLHKLEELDSASSFAGMQNTRTMGLWRLVPMF